jgi:D-alanyl-lipoteichoic acid acyltransferase DltB (MBOAT superfamily)
MNFVSLNFLLFFPVVAITWFILPARFRTWFLIAAGFYFYINSIPVYAILLFSVSLLIYLSGWIIQDTQNPKVRKLYFFLSVTILVLTLFIFKYYDFLNYNIYKLFSLTGLAIRLPEFKLLLPLGISYYTFQSIGYLTDIYTGRIEAEKNFKYCLAFISFFPTIVSGPIERAGNMINQYKNPVSFRYSDTVQGLRWMLWGYFMKLVVADGLGIYINEIFGNSTFQNSSTLILTVVLFPLQLYCDFNGYSSIAVGMAKILGINIMHNFRRPYLFADSIADFWRRNHISLSTWLMDYIYNPLTIRFRQFGIAGLTFASVITFMLAGLWHGSAWNYVIYGSLHGVLLSFEILTNKKRKKFEREWNLKNRMWYIGLTCIGTYFLVCVTFIFFRSNTVGQALGIFKNISDWGGTVYLGSSAARLAFSVLALILVILSDFRDEFFPGQIVFFENKLRAVRWASYIAVVLMILLLGNFNSEQFIYLQF